jgi:SAM-dependent methyltransferase
VTSLDRPDLSKNHSRLFFKLDYALRYPRRVLPYGRRWARDMRFRLRTRDHVSYYRTVMRANVARSPEVAVGGGTHEAWLRQGQTQFDYLLAHGLDPTMRVLEIGCGNLRAGRLLIDYLEPGNYYGIDISPDILLAALETITRFGLETKLPRLTLVQDLKFEFLPPETFDVIHAHSVFSHSPIEVIEECLCHVGRIMAPGAFFDFTFKLTEGTEHQVLREDFYYRTKSLIALATRHGLAARYMDDWGPPLSQQSKLRVTRCIPPSVTA